MPAALRFVTPMECREVKTIREIPRGKSWQYEIKFDGYRCIAIKQHNDVELHSRNGKSFTQFENLFDVIRERRPRSFILDGEIVALDPDGRSNFNALQRAKSKGVDVHFYAFDLLNLDGKSLLNEPLVERQELLYSSFSSDDYFHFSKPLHGKIETIIKSIAKFGFEGVIAKDRESIYTPGKIPGSWVKRKLKQSDEFIIGGYIPADGGVDSILVGKFAGEELMFVEDVGDGFIPATRQQVLKAIQRLKIAETPFANLKGKQRDRHIDKEKVEQIVWVKPKTVVEIAMNEWTPDRHLRHAEFRRLRPDKPIEDVSSYPQT